MSSPAREPGTDRGADATSGDPAARRPPTDAERRALASVMRLRILRMCRYEPLTNKAIADRLHRDPATVLHHVRTLVNAGFLQAGDPRSGPRGSREVPYRATGKSWQLDLAGTGESAAGGNTILRTFFEEVSEVPAHTVDTTRLGLKLDPDDLAEFRHRLWTLLDEYARKEPDGDGDPCSVFVAVYPEPS
ncbi:helix-turn-helix domain-containing protein [Nakamurella sp. YIM 132087]|uniref:Helix-turn-helix domain-containing protein n=1 Tax=Nakamurella alba TaxID=2665158 RepID=A0A7K1FR44_9ACTN|nr:winged helix-turn-helix domain-containing protein [Nakamurella alba]MTD16540.1 helix-turn-helix domain-containing protein [Nakamurella alba]